jgi:hypothetical protein
MTCSRSAGQNRSGLDNLIKSIAFTSKKSKKYYFMKVNLSLKSTTSITPMKKK